MPEVLKGKIRLEFDDPNFAHKLSLDESIEIGWYS